MSVLFLTEGGKGYGLGHISRTKSIAEALEEEWVESVFICDIPEDMVLGDSSVRRFAWFKDEERLKSEIAAIDNIEAIVVDSYNASLKTLRRLSDFPSPILFIDDYYRVEYPKGIIVNPTNLKYPEIFGRRVFSGPEYLPLRSAFWDAAPLSLSERKYTLVTLGGVKDYEVFLPLINTVRESVEGEIIALTASGSSLPEPNGVKYVDPNLDMHDMRAYLQSARIVICGGGVTLAEAARLGTPAVTVALAQNQMGNIKLFCMAGSALFAGNAWTKDLASNAAKKIAILNDGDLWERFSSRGASLLDGQGARRIAKILTLEIDGVFYHDELRKDHEINGLWLTHFANCSNEEFEMILASRNSDAVRSTIYSREAISHAAQAEFIKSLETSVTSAYWLVSEGDDYLGVFSLTGVDRFYSECEVGYYKFSSSEKKGIGKLLLEAAAEVAFNRLNLSSVTAETFGDNTASVKSLERSGFIFEGETEKITAGEKKTVYRYRLKKNDN
jgi:UDP-4-amino-4,6-dideoxy-N-acetyl-beta-L-altrosamine N-acetyltransferase